jgi:hypothetical protein
MVSAHGGDVLILNVGIIGRGVRTRGGSQAEMKLASGRREASRG